MGEPSGDAGAACRLLEWDSRFFGLRIARAEPPALQCDAGRAVERWCDLHCVDCVYLLADVQDQATIDLTQSQGFRLVDIRMTLEAKGPPAVRRTLDPAHCNIRVAEERDMESLKAIARQSHRDSRFYADGHFDRRRCDDMYEAWIAKSCGGWAERVVVAEVEGSPVGYVTCHVHTPGEGQIGLVAVDSTGRGRGTGLAMIDEALHWFADHHVTTVSVVTQGRNPRALRFYQRAGFTLTLMQLWYHRWSQSHRS
jgi:dTDP-4-amino-4,6-dideoxy-D-galactose acyltransferase